jgi:hypothetical protein
MRFWTPPKSKRKPKTAESAHELQRVYIRPGLTADTIDELFQLRSNRQISRREFQAGKRKLGCRPDITQDSKRIRFHGRGRGAKQEFGTIPNPKRSEYRSRWVNRGSSSN